ncbi:type I-C CRISPR-associated protein Cas8c/Csd1 [candidate division KSB1 bacterium]|nr:type I-C CRISPR-associated protein Cas8c/Csd1 [candidate division KSB1 bacterium]RQW04205.1 MAG: type I-C CRISPR-associated protein Cas8c/Csd1 [candidate division KSB1 bacterium]
MGWIQKLAATYDNSQAKIGYAEQEKQRPLLPICHITTQAHIEIAIDVEGNFRRARIVTEKSDSTTIIPCTEGSGSRAGSKPENHSLCDKLQYVAGDFVEYGGTVTSGFSKDPEEPYRNFVNTLAPWCDSEFGHAKARAVLKYIKKKKVVEDLVKHKILIIGADGKFARKEDLKREKNVKDIFSVIDPQENAFVRWVVETFGESESMLWRDKSLWDSWTKYYLSERKEKSFCYVTGKDQVLTTNHPKYIRREGDGAKLISANDTSGFTFRGRFITHAQACGVSLETSHKSHYALQWLISKQGYNRNELAIVAWATSGAPVPQPTDSAQFLLWGDAPSEEEVNVYTAQEIGIQIKKRIAGYGKALKKIDDVIVMAFDSATTGRMAITYYRDLKGSDYLKRIDDWHESCAWRHTYHAIEERDEKGRIKKRYIPFYGAPTPADIAEAAYATNRNGKAELDEKLLKATIKRLLPCIVDGQPLPRDIAESVVRRTSNRIALEKWQWEKALTIACALFRKFKQGKEKYKMSLDESRKTRDYLYGRLLAIADVLEERALSKAEQNRPTNAARYMQQFSQRPFRTWKQIHDLLAPYIMRLGGKAYYYKNLIAEVEGLFDTEDFLSPKPLTGEYLLGYYCQRQRLWEKKDKSTSEEENIDETLEQ